MTLTSLPGPREVELVATGIGGVLEGIKPGCVYIDLSTSRPTLIRELEVKFRAKGVTCWTRRSAVARAARRVATLP